VAISGDWGGLAMKKTEAECGWCESYLEDVPERCAVCMKYRNFSADATNGPDGKPDPALVADFGLLVDMFERFNRDQQRAVIQYLELINREDESLEEQEAGTFT
jgi:hypothetical protein